MTCLMEGWWFADTASLLRHNNSLVMEYIHVGGRGSSCLPPKLAEHPRQSWRKVVRVREGGEDSEGEGRWYKESEQQQRVISIH